MRLKHLIFLIETERNSIIGRLSIPQDISNQSRNQRIEFRRHTNKSIESHSEDIVSSFIQGDTNSKREIRTFYNRNAPSDENIINPAGNYKSTQILQNNQFCSKFTQFVIKSKI